MINHYGSLTFGHYTAVVKNLYEQNWYTYDDSNRILLPEDSIAKDNAYILFYVRKDLQDKSYKDIYSNLQS